MQLTRSSGILMPVFSLPSPYGIGTMGRAARDFIDFLADACQKYWQVLPLGPSSCGDCPYQSFSAFAGNPYLIDLDLLIEESLLTKEEVEDIPWGDDPEQVNYARLYDHRMALLSVAADRGLAKRTEAFSLFARQNETWLPDYSLFMALKHHFGMAPWPEWPDEEIRLHRRDACERYRSLLRDEIDRQAYIQYLFFSQWEALRKYASQKDIDIIGDMPIYVALDSADVWAEPQWFMLDENNVPTDVSGVPPDYFNADGQLWNNPLYNWDAIARDGFGWWIRRVDGAFRLYDMLRIDHFRGLASYWAVPYGETTAKNGRWIKGPGMALVGVLTSWFADKSFIAEDLGILTPDVRDLLAQSGLPGMTVLQFAFDWQQPSSYLPHSHVPNSVCYTGTHDNDTLGGWLAAADPRELAFARDYLGLNDEEGLAWGVIRGGMGSVANLFVAQMQDYLALGTEARMNVPGVAEGNWRWRMRPDAITPALARRIAAMTGRYGRAPFIPAEPADDTDDPQQCRT